MSPKASTRPAPPADEPCPCGRPALESACCGRYRSGGPLEGAAPDAESLMRSRYTAYVRGDTAWLLASWHPSTRPQRIEPDPPGLRWLGLSVLAHRPLGADRAEVRFVARSKLAGRAHRMEETSRFVREDGRWYYLDAVEPPGGQ